MSADNDRIIAEIERLTLETTDMRAAQLFVERVKLVNQVKWWKNGGMAVGFLVGLIAFFFLLPDSDWKFIEAGGIALAVFIVIAVMGRFVLGAKAEGWLARARQVVGE